MNKNELLKERTRLGVLKELLASWNKGKILIAGCGSGRDVTISAQRLVAFDLSYAAVKGSRERYRDNSYFIADLSSIPLKNAVVNCVVCSEVIEHVVTPAKAIREFQRVLAANGTLILTVPNWISWYGFVRVLVEFITRKPVTAAYQPVDNWYTHTSLCRLLAPCFKVSVWRGIWYYPPIGRRDALLPIVITNFFMQILQPVNVLLGKLLPIYGHCLSVVCHKINSE
jgi:ubiquinone/menaquinone biosynthesis C-methylase UbiE